MSVAASPGAPQLALLVIQAASRTDLTAVLQLPVRWAPEQLRSQYRQLSRTFHPDKNLSQPPSAQLLLSRAFIAVGQAYNTLLSSGPPLAPSPPHPRTGPVIPEARSRNPRSRVPHDAPIRRRRPSATSASTPPAQPTPQPQPTPTAQPTSAPKAAAPERSPPPSRQKRGVQVPEHVLCQADGGILGRAINRMGVREMDDAAADVEQELDELQVTCSSVFCVATCGWQAELRQWLDQFSAEMSQADTKQSNDSVEGFEQLRQGCRMQAVNQNKQAVPEQLFVWVSDSGRQMHWRYTKSSSGAPAESLLINSIGSVKCAGKVAVIVTTDGQSLKFRATCADLAKVWARRVARQVKWIKNGGAHAANKTLVPFKSK